MRRSSLSLALFICLGLVLVMIFMEQTTAAPPNGDPVPGVMTSNGGGLPDGDGVPSFGGGFPTPTPNIPVATSFTYQGRIDRSGGAYTGACDFRFTLHDRSVGGDQVGPTLNQTLNVQDGLFTTSLNFGASPYTGFSLWLRIAVSCPSGGALTALSPAQPLTAAPFALGLRPGTFIEGQIPNDGVLEVRNADVGGWGIEGSGRSEGVRGTGLGLNSRGVYGAAIATGVEGEASIFGVIGRGARGVQGESTYLGGIGVNGIANEGGEAWGVAGSSEPGKGVFGRSRDNIGVCGDHKGAGGVWSDDCPDGPYGVYGRSFSTVIAAAGVVGEIMSTSPGGFSAGVRGINRGTGSLGIGVAGSHEGAGWGVYGFSETGLGVFGTSGSLFANKDQDTDGASFSSHTGVYGRSNHTNGTGVAGVAYNGTSATGVYGQSDDGRGVYGESDAGIGVYGIHKDTTGTSPGVKGETLSTSSNAVGVLGQVTSTSPGGSSAAVRGINNGTGGSGIGVWGSHDGSGWGVYGESESGRGVYGRSSTGNGVYGLHASNTDADAGVRGDTNSTVANAAGVYGSVNSSSPGTDSAGVRGVNSGTNNNGYGVYGSHNGGGVGVYGRSDTGAGVYGLHNDTTGTEPGVKGETNSTSSSAVGVLGRVTSSSPGGSSAGVRGINEGTGGSGIGVYGSHDGSGWGMYGTAPSGRGVYGSTTSGVGVYGNGGSSGKAGYFSGDVHVTGDLTKAYSSGTSNSAAPLAYGYISSAGAVGTATPNVTSLWNGTLDRYEITITGETYVISNYVTVVTPTSGPYLARTSNFSGKLLVYIYNLQGQSIQAGFSFIVYKP